MGTSSHILASLENTYNLAQKVFESKIQLLAQNFAEEIGNAEQLTQDMVLANNGDADDIEKQGQEVLASIKNQFVSGMKLAEQEFADVKNSLAETAKAQKLDFPIDHNHYKKILDN